ncbi:MAG TPA: hypothetical protein VGB77_18165, partial [Abditibacteriaceae bacterium]
YALTIYKTLNVPVGIINTSQGASKISTWMDLPTLKSDPYYAGIIEEGTKKIAEYPAIKAKLDADVKKWEADKVVAEAAKTPFTTPRTC